MEEWAKNDRKLLKSRKRGCPCAPVHEATYLAHGTLFVTVPRAPAQFDLTGLSVFSVIEA
jgi:hypothetical protein